MADHHWVAFYRCPHCGTTVKVFFNTLEGVSDTRSCDVEYGDDARSMQLVKVLPTKSYLQKLGIEMKGGFDDTPRI